MSYCIKTAPYKDYDGVLLEWTTHPNKRKAIRRAMECDIVCEGRTWRQMKRDGMRVVIVDVVERESDVKKASVQECRQILARHKHKK